jgi:ABC-2 type transport system ATP-binding protein
MEEIIELDHIWKYYGRTLALRDITIKFPKKSIYLLMGPNGSGKTTLFRIILGLIKPSRGHVRVLGLDPFKERHNLFSHIGAMFEDHSPPGWITGREFLYYIAKLKRLRDIDNEVLHVAKLLDIVDFWDQPISSYSSGMRRKIALAHAFLGDPELIFLDDPTVALDKQGRNTLKNIITENKDKTYIIASHIITEFEDIATHIAVLNEGVLRVAGKIEDVALKLGVAKIRILTDKPDRAMKILISNGYKVSIERNNIYLEGKLNYNDILYLLREHGLNADIEWAGVDLWNIYSKAL